MGGMLVKSETLSLLPFAVITGLHFKEICKMSHNPRGCHGGGDGPGAYGASQAGTVTVTVTTVRRSRESSIR